MFADGIRLFATALVISVVTQVPVNITVIALGVAIIIYTVRGGVSAVIWTDVVQMFVYVAGGLAGLRRPALPDSGWMGRGRADGRRQRPLPRLRFQHRPGAHLHVLGRAVLVSR